MIMQQKEVYEWAKRLQDNKNRVHLSEQGLDVTTFEVGEYVLAN